MISFLAEHRDSSVEIVQNIQMHLFYFINSTHSSSIETVPSIWMWFLLTQHRDSSVGIVHSIQTCSISDTTQGSSVEIAHNMKASYLQLTQRKETAALI